MVDVVVVVAAGMLAVDEDDTVGVDVIEVGMLEVVGATEAPCLFCCVSMEVVLADDWRRCCVCSLACQPIMISSEFMIDLKQVSGPRL
jgi:hypothetical protein